MLELLKPSLRGSIPCNYNAILRLSPLPMSPQLTHFRFVRALMELLAPAEFSDSRPDPRAYAFLRHPPATDGLCAVRDVGLRTTDVSYN